jgi:hypothetical protein
MGGWMVSATPQPCFTSRVTTPDIHWTRGWVGPRAGLVTDGGKILLPLPGIEPQPPGRIVHSQTLYWLSYPGSHRTEQSVFLFLITACFLHLIHSNPSPTKGLYSWNTTWLVNPWLARSRPYTRQNHHHNGSLETIKLVLNAITDLPPANASCCKGASLHLCDKSFFTFIHRYWIVCKVLECLHHIKM